MNNNEKCVNIQNLLHSFNGWKQNIFMRQMYIYFGKHFCYLTDSPFAKAGRTTFLCYNSALRFSWLNVRRALLDVANRAVWKIFWFHLRVNAEAYSQHKVKPKKKEFSEIIAIPCICAAHVHIIFDFFVFRFYLCLCLCFEFTTNYFWRINKYWRKISECKWAETTTEMDRVTLF